MGEEVQYVLFVANAPFTMEVLEMRLSSSFDLIEASADQRSSGFYFQDMIVGEASSILAMEVGSISIS